MLKGHHSRRLAFALLILLLLHAPTTHLLSTGNSGTAFAKLTPKDPAVLAAVAKGIAFLQRQGMRAGEGHRSFAAATCMKAGVPPEDPFVRVEIARIMKKFAVGYSAEDNNYATCAELMTLCIARRYEIEHNGKATAYDKEIQHLIDFLISKQNGGGDWDYFGRASNQGDTSQTQFVLLALWSAAEEGFDIPQAVWEKSAMWLLETQFDDGGFSYHPKGPVDHGVEHGMTVAGVTGLMIARMHLFTPEEIEKAGGQVADDEAEKSKKKEDENPFVAGVADKAEEGPNFEKEGAPKKKPKAAAQKPAVSLVSISNAISKGLGWLVARYQMEKVERYDLYYRYGVERMTALIGAEELGGNDWYTQGAQFFLSEQLEDGSWGKTTYDGTNAGTCFGILFLTRATWKVVKRAPPPPPPNTLVNGQQRGFKGDIRQMTAGGEAAPPPTGPLEELLADLIKNPQGKEAPKRAEALAAKLIKEVRDNPNKRQELIGQKDQIKLLVELPNDEARIAALWALGRCEDLSLAPILIKALADDNIDVSTAARDALCVLSRRPLGEGLARHPWDEIPEDAKDEVKTKAFLDWRNQALERWKEWYSRIRPYDQRDDLSDVGPATN